MDTVLIFIILAIVIAIAYILSQPLLKTKNHQDSTGDENNTDSQNQTRSKHQDTHPNDSSQD